MNRFLLCIEQAEESKRTHRERERARVEAWYQSHPECNYQLLAVTRGKTIRDAKTRIDVSQRHGVGWWDTIDAGTIWDERTSKFRWWADGMTAEEISHQRSAPGRRVGAYDIDAA